MRTRVCGSCGFVSFSVSSASVSFGFGIAPAQILASYHGAVCRSEGFIPLAICIALSTVFQLAMTAATASVPLLNVPNFSSSCCICPARPADRSRNCFRLSSSSFFSLMRDCRTEDCEFVDACPPSPEDGRIMPDVGRGAYAMFVVVQERSRYISLVVFHAM